MDRILITGGAGYLGSVLTPILLNKNFKVTVLDNLMYEKNSLLSCCSNKNFEFHNGDVTNTSLLSSLLKKNDIIIPLAAIVGAPASEKNPKISKSINLDSIREMINHMSKTQYLLYPTTNSGYGIGESGKFCTETSPLNPISEYGRNKVEAEKIIIERDNSVSFRLATVFGVSPRMRTDLLVNDFTLKAVKDGYIILFQENFKRNFIHIKDIANVFHFAIENFSKLKNEIYNVGLEDTNISKLELAERIKKYIPNFYIHSASIGEDPDKRDYIVSNKKILSTGWKPDYSLDDGIKELIKCYKILKINQFSNI
tara:strand:+ start:237 stop:1172 length:936 start_codon:yes stop_codon:yes gene_type:complete